MDRAAASDSDTVLDILLQEPRALATDWDRRQRERGLRRVALFSEEEAREDEGWADLRAVLADITEDRIERGVTPADMARYVIALKEPVFDRLQQCLSDRPEILATEIACATRLVDAFVLLVIDVFQKGRDAIIERQQTEMVELSTPLVQLWDGVLALPLIGTLDSICAQDVMENLLEAIVARQAEVVILDITGVQTVDTQVAQHLLRTAAAVRLMGATCVISGISPHIAQTMVQLGVEVGDVVTRADIQSALVFAFQQIGKRVADRADG